MQKHTLRLLGALVFFLWAGFTLAAFYVVQKPALLGVARGLGATLWTLAVWALLVFNAWGTGSFLLRKAGGEQASAADRALLGTGIGLGLLGLAGLLAGALGVVSLPALLGVQVALAALLIWRRAWHHQKADLKALKTSWASTLTRIHFLAKLAFGLVFLCAFLLALAPPGDGFDALLYHLPWPEHILLDGGIYLYNISPFWYPGLVEGAFFWALGLNAVRAAQLLHLTWGTLAIALLWHWAKSVWDEKVALKTLAIVLSMPSLYLLASWAYTDLALVFFGLATLYGVFRAAQNESGAHTWGWVLLSGAAAGMAMGVKYTSFPIPLTGGLLFLWWGHKRPQKGLLAAAGFSVTALLVASPWYLRNWLVMGNPFYPFIFGGLYWDEFRAAWYAEAGTGIGWNLRELFLLPFNATLGHRDANFYDGRVGVLFLLFAPLALYVLATGRKFPRPQWRTLLAIGLFALLSFAAWGFGVINSAALWQTRLLFPALIPFALPTALGWAATRKLDSPNLRISFIANIIVAAVIFVTASDAALSVIARNPLAYMAGVETRDAYLSKVQPHYAQAIELVAQTPQDAKIYALFEPRSYYLPREVQPDPILDNFAHDLYRSGTPEAVVQFWKDAGYTHVLLYRRGVAFLMDNAPHKFPPAHQAALEAITSEYLELSGATPDGAYELYRIR